MDVTLADQIAEVSLELALREQVYPTLIKRNTLDPDEAQYHMQCLEAALKTLALVDFAQRQLPLFPGGV